MTNWKPHRWSESEVVANFRYQVRRLRRAMEVYDQGELQEAVAIATSIYLLVHDGGNSTSILKQIKRKEGRKWVDSSAERMREKMKSPNSIKEIYPPPLCVWRGDVSGFRYAPRCDGQEDHIPADIRRVSFSTWWEQTIFQAFNGTKLSRKNLVFRLRSQEGGAHFDQSRRDEALHWLAVDPVPSVRAVASGALQIGVIGRDKIEGAPLGNAHFATMRQMGWETDLVIRESCADILEQ